MSFDHVKTVLSGGNFIVINTLHRGRQYLDQKCRVDESVFMKSIKLFESLRSDDCWENTTRAHTRVVVFFAVRLANGAHKKTEF